MIFKRFLFAAATLTVCLLAVLLLIYEPYASEAVRVTLTLFIRRVLPPLFPYMILSRLIVSMDLFAPFQRILRTDRWFRLPSGASSVILTGLLCGCPVGAAGTCTLYERGGISRPAAGRLAALSSNASPAFLLGTAAALWNSKIYGGFLLAVQTVSAVLIAFFLARLLTDRNTSSPDCPDTPESVPVRNGRFSEELCRAISDSASACLTVCAYIVCFRVLAVLVSRFLSWPSAAVLFEFSSGCADGASVGGRMGMFMTGFAVGSAGLSVMTQNYNFLGRYGIPMSALWITKGIQGLLCGAASAVFFTVCPAEPAQTAGTAVLSGGMVSVNTVVLMLSVLLLLSKFHKIAARRI